MKKFSREILMKKYFFYFNYMIYMIYENILLQKLNYKLNLKKLSLKEKRNVIFCILLSIK